MWLISCPQRWHGTRSGVAPASAGLLRAGGRLSPTAACSACHGLSGTGPQGSSGPAPTQSQQVTKSHLIQCWQRTANQAGRAKAASPSPATSVFFFFFFRHHQRVYVATGTCKCQPPTDPRPPSLPRATSWHLKWRVAKQLINCPAGSSCQLCCPLLTSLFSSLWFLPCPTYMQYKPTELQEALTLGKKAASAAQRAPRSVVGDPCPAQMPHASFAPKPVFQAIPPRPGLYFTCICSWAGAGRNHSGLSPLQQGTSPWSPTTWGCTAGRGISPLTPICSYSRNPCWYHSCFSHLFSHLVDHHSKAVKALKPSCNAAVASLQR